MPLDSKTRDDLENLIEGYVHNTRKLGFFKTDSHGWQIRDLDEFLFGFAVCKILDGCNDVFEQTFGREMNDEELTDFFNLVKGRLPLVRNWLQNDIK